VEMVKRWAIKIWSGLATWGKILLAGIPALLAILYALQSRRHRANKIDLERKASRAGDGKAESIKAVSYLQDRAKEAADKADGYQKLAGAQVKRLKGKRKATADEAIAMTERINGRLK